MARNIPCDTFMRWWIVHNAKALHINLIVVSQVTKCFNVGLPSTCPLIELQAHIFELKLERNTWKRRP
jgi:hypothetical protein